MERVTGILLAGGQARRMGGIDKGLQPLHGRPMAAWAIDRLAPQVDEILINANQNAEAYARFGHRVVPDAHFDERGGFAGPLAGLHAGMQAASHALVVTVPCDSPYLARDLVARLRAALEESGADLAVAKTGDQPHPVFMLARRALRAHLAAFLAAGGRKMDAWYATLNAVEVPFDDQPQAFSNINTRDELAAFEARPA